MLLLRTLLSTTSLRLGIFAAATAAIVLIPAGYAAATPVSVQLEGTGAGTVASSVPGENGNAINCSNVGNPGGAGVGVCSESFPAFFRVNLTETPDAGYQFDAWSGPCSGAESSCSFTPTFSAIAVGASFVRSLPPPTVTIGPPSDINSGEATFHGTVNPNGNDAHWHFEYRSVGSVHWTSVPVPDRDAGAGETATPVEVTAGGLEPNTEYEAQLWAGNGASAETSGIERFRTLAIPPDVSTESAFSVSDTTATLTGAVDPHSAALTDCHFRYGTDEGLTFEAPCSPGPGRINSPDEVQQFAVRATKGTFTLSFSGETTGSIAFDAPAAVVESKLRSLSSIGTPNVSVTGGPGDTSGSNPYVVTFENALERRNVEQMTGSMQGVSQGEGIAVSTVSPGGVPVEVSANVSGLLPGTGYRYQLVATNVCEAGCGRIAGEVRTFDSRPSIALPARHFELVSAAETNGEEALAGVASSDGERYGYSSFLPTPPDPVSGYRSLYLSSRGPSGAWSQAGIEAPPAPGEVDLGTGNVFFSSDLGKVALSTRNGLDPDDRNEAKDSYYLDQPEVRHFVWMSRDPGVLGPQTEGGGAEPIDMSSDGGLVILRSERPLLPDAIDGVTGLYEWSHGGLSLISRIPQPGAAACDDSSGDVACTTAPEESILGSGSGGAGIPTTNYGAVSDDGRRIVFTVGATPATRRLYLRLDGTKTREVSYSSIDLSPVNVRYQGADEKLERVFFTSSSPLTADSQAPDMETGPADLYAYEVGTESVRDLTPSPGGAGVERVYDVATDGGRVYFTSSKRLNQAGHLTEEGQSLQGAPGGPNLYLAELEGSSVTLRFIAPIDSAEGSAGGGLSQPQAWREVAANPDGSLLAFRDRLALIPGRITGGRPQVFVYDASRDELSCASCPSGGALPAAANLVAAKGNAEVEPGEGLAGDQFTEGSGPHPRSVSTAGAVFFQTKTSLLPADTNGRIDVYEWNGNRLGLVSAGSGVQRSIFAGASADGATVFFQSADSLVSAAQSGIQHIYAARVGTPPESSSPSPPCSGADCRSLPSSAIKAMGSPASAVFSGAGNTRPGRCGKGKVRNGARCVRKECGRGKVASGKRCVSIRKIARRICHKKDDRTRRRCIHHNVQRMTKRQHARRICKTERGAARRGRVHPSTDEAPERQTCCRRPPGVGPSRLSSNCSTDPRGTK